MEVAATRATCVTTRREASLTITSVSVAGTGASGVSSSSIRDASRAGPSSRRPSMTSYAPRSTASSRRSCVTGSSDHQIQRGSCGARGARVPVRVRTIRIVPTLGVGLTSILRLFRRALSLADGAGPLQVTVGMTII